MIVNYHGKPWHLGSDRFLKQLAEQNTPISIIAIKLGRSEQAVRTRARKLNISLKKENN